jgi:hypothetical protein
MAKSSKAVQYKELSSYLRELAKSGQLPSGLKLDAATTIGDGKMFVDSHLTFLDGVMRRFKSGDKVNKPIWEPSYDRLINYYFQVKEKNNQ